MLAKKTLLNIGSSVFLRSFKKPDAGLEHVISGESGTFGKLNLFQSGAAKKCTFADFGHGRGNLYVCQMITFIKRRLSDA